MPCHESGDGPVGPKPVVLVGNPNVGKSVIFGALTGRYVAVSNYPGTTVEITRGTLGINGASRPVIDTPGVYSITALSDDERVTRNILLEQGEATIIQVADAKNLQRSLFMALELAETGLPFVLDLNMTDEAQARGIEIDAPRLEALLGAPVIPTVATRTAGAQPLLARLEQARISTFSLVYPAVIEETVATLIPLLPVTALSPRGLALMALSGDEELLTYLEISSPIQSRIHQMIQKLTAQLGRGPAQAIQETRHRAARDLAAQCTTFSPTERGWGWRLGQWATHRLYGWPILGLVLYLLYQFVGVLGAGTLVDLLESRLFGAWLNPAAVWLVERLIPFTLVQDFLIGEYGLITMALTYSLAIVLPIVGTFFLAFSVLEDSGYLPRLAVMLDRAFRWMGLNGKAVLPMILGLGCDTMATMTTRILESRKERLQVTLLLALGIPCSAQLGVILGMVSGLGALATTIWISVVALTMLAVGFLSARLIPGEGSDFILELPPMRLPEARNILLKTVARMEWYIQEVVPVFVTGTAILFVLDKVKLLAVIERLLSPLISGWLGLPAEVADIFLIGFLRRDYGAAGLFAIARTGALDPVQITVSLVVITLFIPCIANLLMIVKEYGGRTAVAVSLVVFPMAFLVGGVLNWALRGLGILTG